MLRSVTVLAALLNTLVFVSAEQLPKLGSLSALSALKDHFWFSQGQGSPAKHRPGENLGQIHGRSLNDTDLVVENVGGGMGLFMDIRLSNVGEQNHQVNFTGSVSDDGNDTWYHNRVIDDSRLSYSISSRNDTGLTFEIRTEDFMRFNFDQATISCPIIMGDAEADQKKWESIEADIFQSFSPEDRQIISLAKDMGVWNLNEDEQQVFEQYTDLLTPAAEEFILEGAVCKDIISIGNWTIEYALSTQMAAVNSSMSINMGEKALILRYSHASSNDISIDDMILLDHNMTNIEIYNSEKERLYGTAMLLVSPSMLERVNITDVNNSTET